MNRLSFAVRELLNPKSSEFYTLTVNFALHLVTGVLVYVGMEQAKIDELLPAASNLLNGLMVYGGGRVVSKLAKGPSTP